MNYSQKRQSSEEIEKVNSISEKIRAEMLKISRLKEISSSAYPIHLAFGHEVLAACVSIVKKEGDKFVLTHRNIHFNLALSEEGDWDKITSETQAKKDGINQGLYGCMTMRNRRAGIAYTSSILGNNLSVGLGISSTLNEFNTTWIQMGDGSIEEGSFYEGLVFAVARRLNIIVLVENNNWSLGSSIHERRGEINLSKLSQSIGMEYTCIFLDESVEDMLAKLENARNLSSNKPQIIECYLKTQGGNYDPKRGYVSYHHGPFKEAS